MVWAMSEHFDDDFAFFDQKNLNAGSAAPTRAGIEEKNELDIYRLSYKIQTNKRAFAKPYAHKQHTHIRSQFVYLK